MEVIKVFKILEGGKVEKRTKEISDGEYLHMLQQNLFYDVDCDYEFKNIFIGDDILVFSDCERQFTEQLNRYLGQKYPNLIKNTFYSDGVNNMF